LEEKLLDSFVNKIRLDFRSSEPIYLQIVRQVEQLVVNGDLHQGDQLPTVRQMATELRVNFNTVARAYRMLDEVGLISTQRGRGTYIWKEPSAATAVELRRQGLHDLVQHFLEESDRLGYSPEEVALELRSQVQTVFNKQDQ
jgi:GntR family transcriptional regulator